MTLDLEVKQTILRSKLNQANMYGKNSKFIKNK